MTTLCASDHPDHAAERFRDVLSAQLKHSTERFCAQLGLNGAETFECVQIALAKYRDERLSYGKAKWHARRQAMRMKRATS